MVSTKILATNNFNTWRDQLFGGGLEGVGRVDQKLKKGRFPPQNLSTIFGPRRLGDINDFKGQ